MTTETNIPTGYIHFQELRRGLFVYPGAADCTSFQPRYGHGEKYLRIEGPKGFSQQKRLASNWKA